MEYAKSWLKYLQENTPNAQAHTLEPCMDSFFVVHLHEP